MSLTQLEQQQPAARILGRSLGKGRLSHALLFTGPVLETLETMARLVAQVLNCQHPPSRGENGAPADCCGRCVSCQRIATGKYSDVLWVRPESKTRVITIDQIRELLQTIHLKPTEGGTKVAILVGADRLNVNAGNAFLKTLEEPPANSILILLSTDPEQILETILSRCLRFAFAAESQPAVEAAMLDWLNEFGKGATATQPGLLQRYRLLSLLLRRLAEIKDEVEKRISQNSPLEQHTDIEPRLREKWEDELSAAIESEYRRRRNEIMVGLEWWFRDVWCKTQGIGSGLLNFSSLEPEMNVMARRLSVSDARENIVAIEETIELLNTNVQEALAIEVGFLRLKL